MLRTVEDSQPQIKTEDWVVFQYLCSFVVMVCSLFSFKWPPKIWQMFGLVFFSFGLIKSSPWIVAVGVLYAFVSIVGFVAARARTRLLARVVGPISYLISFHFLVFLYPSLGNVYYGFIIFFRSYISFCLGVQILRWREFGRWDL